jgi:hypothetical protein
MIVYTKVKFSLEQAMKAQWESSGIEQVINPMPQQLYPWERLGTYCAGGWTDTRVILDKCRKADSHWNSIPKQCSPEQVTTLTTLSQPTLNDSVSH